MKVLIIGYTGMLGQELVKSFQTEHNVISWSRKEIDITNEELVMSKIKEVYPDLIINASAFNDVDGAEKKYDLNEKSKKVNGLGVKYLAKIAKEINSIFVHYSTDYVFDGKAVVYEEDSQTCSISNHGKAKEMGEKYIKEIGGKWYIVRLSRLFGDSSKSEAGKESFFSKILKLVKDNKELKIVSDEISCFTYAPDLAKSTKKLVEEVYQYGVYHLINEGATSWYRGVEKLFKIFEIKNINIISISSDQLVRPAKRPKSSILVNTKFPKLRSFEDAIREWKNK